MWSGERRECSPACTGDSWPPIAESSRSRRTHQLGHIWAGVFLFDPTSIAATGKLSHSAGQEYPGVLEHHSTAVCPPNKPRRARSMALPVTEMRKLRHDTNCSLWTGRKANTSLGPASHRNFRGALPRHADAGEVDPGTLEQRSLLWRRHVPPQRFRNQLFPCLGTGGTSRPRHKAEPSPMPGTFACSATQTRLVASTQ